MALDRRPITSDEIMTAAQLAAMPPERREAFHRLREHRRVPLGEAGRLDFHCRDIAWAELQDAVAAEGVPAERALGAANARLPTGAELVAALRSPLDPDDVDYLATQISLSVEGQIIRGLRDPGAELAAPVLRFPFTPWQIERFTAPGVTVQVVVTHPLHGLVDILSDDVRHALAGDFDGRH